MLKKSIIPFIFCLIITIFNSSDCRSTQSETKANDYIEELPPLSLNKEQDHLLPETLTDISNVPHNLSGQENPGGLPLCVLSLTACDFIGNCAQSKVSALPGGSIITGAASQIAPLIDPNATTLTSAILRRGIKKLSGNEEYLEDSFVNEIESVSTSPSPKDTAPSLDIGFKACDLIGEYAKTLVSSFPGGALVTTLTGNLAPLIDPDAKTLTGALLRTGSRKLFNKPKNIETLPSSKTEEMLQIASSPPSDEKEEEEKINF